MTYMDALCAGASNSPQFDEVFKQANDEVISRIEKHRNSFWPESSDYYPKNLDEYVYYRTKLEVERDHGICPEEMGLDKDTVRIMTHVAKEYFTQARGGAVPETGNTLTLVREAFADGDCATTLRLLRPLADRGEGTAQHILGSMYEEGQGVPENYARL